MKLTPFVHRLEPRRDGGYTVAVQVPCTVCDGTGSRAIVHRHHVTQYENCAVCHGFACTEARRDIYPLSLIHI